MNKQEFIRKIENIDSNFVNVSISDADYKDIEYVYTWHPSIDAVRGKEQIAYLFTEFGMRIIYDMMPTAWMAQEAEQKVLETRKAYEAACAEYEKLKKGTHR